MKYTVDQQMNGSEWAVPRCVPLPDLKRVERLGVHHPSQNLADLAEA